MASSRRRIFTFLATVLSMGSAGGLAWVGAEAAATFLEDRAAREVGLALRGDDYDWVRVETDGLRVRLSGTAPTEVARARAVTQATSAVDTGRILDEMSVAAVEAMTPPEFQVELLRNGQGISLIGLLPTASDRQVILRRLRPIAPQGSLADLLEAADHPVPAGWDDALSFGLEAAAMTRQSKVSILPGRVQVTALTADEEEKAQLEAALRRALPAGVKLGLDISAPRPVIAPFLLRFAVTDGGARLEPCVADDEAARRAIVQAAQAAGLPAMPDCALGLGAPSADWGAAAAAAIEAVGQLGRGTVTLSDALVTLQAPLGVDRTGFAEVVGRLERSLPPAFRLDARLEEPASQPVPAEFNASLGASGALTMQGRIANAQMREAVASFAQSRFDVAQSGLRADPQVPEGWTVRVIAGLEAMETLNSGTLHVTPNLITLTGMSGDPEATARAAALLLERLDAGAAYELAIGYDRYLDPTLDLPDGEECASRLNIIMSESEIGFEPGGAAIAGDPDPTMSQMAEAMADCSAFQLEAGGHTDSQGSEGGNARLSRGRAQAILAAMEQAGIDVSNMTVRGYGESRPVASNQTEEGREANRRIEFRLLSPHPVQAEPPRPPQPVRGVTGAHLPTGAPAGAQPSAVAGADPSGGMQSPRLPPVQGPPVPLPAPFARTQRPELPQPVAATATAPLTVGAQEQFQSLEEREESLRVPVLVPDEDTPRPGPRPEDIADRNAAQDGTPDE